MMIDSNERDDDITNTKTFGTEIPGVNVTLDEINDLLTALKVIADVKYLDKLIWDDSKSLVPNIQVIGPFRFIRRIYNTQNRKNMIEHLNIIIYKSIAAFKFSSTTVRLKNNLIDSIGGLQNLKVTYQNDIMVKNQLDVMIQNIQKMITEKI